MHTDLSVGKSGMSLLQGSVSVAQYFWECKNIWEKCLTTWQHTAELYLEAQATVPNLGSAEHFPLVECSCIYSFIRGEWSFQPILCAVSSEGFCLALKPIPAALWIAWV